MAVATPPRAEEPAAGPAAGGRRALLAPEVLTVIATVAIALALVIGTRPYTFAALPTLALGTLAGLVLFAVCGAALAFALVPGRWGALAPLMALPLGVATSGLVLTALGLAHVPLRVSLWLVLAAGLVAAALVVRRRPLRALAGEWREHRLLACWVAVLAVLLFVALIPAWRTGSATIYGENPDAHQVVGIAVLFQHVSPTGTDIALPIDTVPPAWRFRYPIFYPLAAGANLAHMDPIRLFPAMAGLLLVIAALGFGAFAVRCLRAPPGVGPAVAAVTGLSVITLHLVWHPYWNQLWGLAMLPYALLFGWCALEALDLRLGALFALMIVTLVLAYPLALPDSLVILAALVVVYWRRPRVAAALRSRSWIFAVVAVLVLAPALIGAGIKLYQGVAQLLNPHSSLWQGDVTSYLPPGRFVGTGGGAVPALFVAAVAVLGLRALPRRVAWAVGLAVLVLGLVDIRFRLSSSGAYMDFKQLSFVGAIVLAIAVVAVASLVWSGRRSFAVVGLVLALGWAVAAAVQDRREVLATQAQVTPQMFQIRDWAARLPPGASVRVDIPASGWQLWAVYMLGPHPVDSPTPVLYTTYAHAPYGTRADYSIALKYVPSATGKVILTPTPPHAVNPPVFANSQFVLRRIAWPARLDATPDTSSQRLVEP